MTATSEDRVTTGRELLRVSFDRSGRERSNTEQHVDHADRAAERGVQLGDPYADVGSASRRGAATQNRKGRKNFDRLLEDLRADRFGADELWLWEGSRGSRRVGEWATLLDLLEDRAVKVYVWARDRLFDPTKPHDRAELLNDAVHAELSSGETSLRAKRSQRQRAAQGRPTGRCPFGYRRDYRVEEVGGKLVRDFDQVPHPEEAPLVRELFARFRRGHSLRSIAADWAERGVRNDSARPFSPAHLRALLENPAYAGRRVHDPNRKGRKASAVRTVVKGQWPALVPSAMFDAAQRVLADPARKTSRPGRGVHFLSMIARCGECGGPMAARWRREGAARGRRPIEEQEYVCHKGNCTRIGYDGLNAYAEVVLLGYLARDDVYAALATADESNAAALEVAETEVEKIRADMAEVERQVAAREMPPASGGRILLGMQVELDAAEKGAAGLRAPSRLAGLVEPGADVAERWRDAPMSARRETARMVFSPELVGELRVRRAPRTGSIRTPVAERVAWGVLTEQTANGC